MRILNFGSLNFDYVYTVHHFVMPGETQRATSFQQFLGGKGHNQSIALAKAGACVWHAGLLGQDGEPLRENLSTNGVDVSYVHLSNNATGHALIQVDDAGQNAIIVYPGANGAIEEPFILKVLSNFSHGDLLLLQNEISNASFIIQQAKKQGLRLALNPSPITHDIGAWPLHLIDLFLLNEVEGAALCGQSNSNDMILDLQQKFPKAEILLTLGEKGAVFCKNGKSFSQPAFQTTVVDTTAAGDTFTGYFLAGYSQNDPIEDILRTASMAASLAVSRKGAAASIPTPDEVQHCLAKIES